eukprot:10175632-Heterocapsa_arctica.AAC.1
MSAQTVRPRLHRHRGFRRTTSSTTTTWTARTRRSARAVRVTEVHLMATPLILLRRTTVDSHDVVIDAAFRTAPEAQSFIGFGPRRGP